MGSNELLGVYLNDHLAGAAAGAELAEKLAARGEGTPFGTALSAVAREIREDKDVLEGLVERLGTGRSPVKQAAGWAFEKVTRLRFNRQLTGSDDLTRLLEVESSRWGSRASSSCGGRCGRPPGWTPGSARPTWTA